MMNLAQFAEQVVGRYADQRRVVLPTESISVSDDGFLETGGERYQIGDQAWSALATYSKLQPGALASLELAERAFLLNRRIPRATEFRFPTRMRLTFTGASQNRVVGICDAHLLHLGVDELLSAIVGTVPDGFPAEEVTVDRWRHTEDSFELTLFSPSIKRQPRPGDVINGGVYIRYSTTGEFATDVKCFVRRFVCANGQIQHVCVGKDQVARTRRLSAERHEQQAMIEQLDRLLRRAWSQLDEKLDALKDLLNQPPADSGIFERYRARLGLNNRLIEAIETAMHEDELEPTDSLYDFVNAVSRVATHGSDELLTPRQRRTLLRGAGELSLRHVRRCSACGTWLDARDSDETGLN